MPNKLSILIKPGQSGKTHKIEELIHENTHTQVNFIFGPKNCVLNRQTKNRISHSIVWDSKEKHKNQKPQSVEDMYTHIVEYITHNTNINVVSCTTSQFLDRVNTLIYLLDTKHEKIKVGIYLDEADVSMNQWKESLFMWNVTNCVESVIAVTATPLHIFRHIDTNIKVIGLCKDEIIRPMYHHFDDSKVVHNSTWDMIKHTSIEMLQDIEDGKLGNYELFLPNKKTFIPGTIKCVSHDEIAMYVTSKDRKNPGVVFVFNGKKRELRFPDGKIVDLRDNLMGKNAMEQKYVIARSIQNIQTSYISYICDWI